MSAAAPRIAFLVAGFLLSGAAWAKPVEVDWKPMKNASGYEIRFQRSGGKDGVTVAVRRTKNAHWSGDLPFGVFAYQIRAIDKIDRPGKWSALHPLVVMPSAPEIIAPRDSQKIISYDPKAKPLLKWKSVAGVSRYFVEVRQGERRVFSTETGEREIPFEAPGPGEFSWQVRPVVATGKNSPPELRGRSWKGNQGETAQFSLDYRKLGAPEVIFPMGLVSLPKSGAVHFKWKPVEGAEAYEIQIDPAPGRKPSSDGKLPQARKVIVTDPSRVLDAMSEGAWRWQVRALASVDPKTHAAGVEGGESHADFQLVRKSDHLDGMGYVAFSTMLAPYKYEAESPQFGGNAATDSTALTLRLSGEYWVLPKLAIAAGLDHTLFSIYGQSLSRSAEELLAKTQIALSPGRQGWYLLPKAGFERREYLRLIPNVSATASSSSLADDESFNAFGASVGFDLRKQFNDRFSLGAKFAYFLPLSLSGTPSGSKLGTHSSYRNTSLGVQALYWLNAAWGLGAGAFIENRSIGYYPGANGSPGSNPEQITMDATYFFGSLIYSWGR